MAVCHNLRSRAERVILPISLRTCKSNSLIFIMMNSTDCAGIENNNNNVKYRDILLSCVYLSCIRRAFNVLALFSAIQLFSYNKRLNTISHLFKTNLSKIYISRKNFGLSAASLHNIHPCPVLGRWLSLRNLSL